MDIFIANSIYKNYEKFGEEIFHLGGEMAIFAKSRLRPKSYHPLRENDPYIIFPDRIRSMGKGYVFTLVCHSVHGGGGGCSPGKADSPGRQTPPQEGRPLPPPPPHGMATAAIGTHPTGMYLCVM